MAVVLDNYYKILGVEPQASTGRIKHAFHVLALKYHPDKSGTPDTASLFIKVYEAYRVLSDTNLRKEYDNTEKGTSPYSADFLAKIRGEATSYSTNYRSFSRDFLVLFIIDVLFSYDRFSFAAVLLILIGTWTTILRLLQLRFVESLIGLGLFLLGTWFFQIAASRVRSEQDELNEYAEQVHRDRQRQSK